MAETARAIPVHAVFSPNWWFRQYGITFDEDFYLHAGRRIEDDVKMRRALWERFGLGSGEIAPRPVAGSMHIAGGFVMPALFGNTIRFTKDQAAWPEVSERNREEVLALTAPELEKTWPMSVLLPQMEELRARYGYVVGDLNTGGLLNNAMEQRGNQFFLDMMEDAELTEHLLGVLGETQAAVAARVKSYTGTCGLATNVSVEACDASLYLHSNCSVQMISPALYAGRLLPYEKKLAAAMRPYGIHHCGNNVQLFAGHYAQLEPVYVDVGWGSDIGRCAAALPDAFLNLRLSPVRMLQEGAEAIYADTLNALRAAGRRALVGVCCINMDAETPDGNVKAMFEAAAEYGEELGG
jgi:hypothetical protein